MKAKEPNILNSFIKTPNLKINTEQYRFGDFDFLDEEITERKFHFPKDSVLGMQAEACFEAYLKKSKNYELLVANLQIQGEEQTLGELDYIVRNLITNSTIHIELACKFYLYDENAGATDEEKWIGPNRKDCLYDKLEKVRSRQFPLLYKKEALKKLKTLNIEVPMLQELCLKAFLFLPKEMEVKEFTKNFQDCIVGFWIRPSELTEGGESAVYAIPSKKEWLLPVESIKNWHPFSEIKKEIDIRLQNKKSPLVYKKTLHKIERFFVVWW